MQEQVEVEIDGHIDLKILLLGARYTGKTTLFKILSGQRPDQSNYTTTVGVECFNMARKVQLTSHDEPVRFHIFDTAGTLKNRAVTLTHLRRCQCAILVVNMADRSSFDIAKYLYEEYKQHNSTAHRLKVLMLANQGEIDQSKKNQRSLDNSAMISSGGNNPVEAFCRQQSIEYQEVNLKTNPADVKSFVEHYFVRFCKENYDLLKAEKQDLEPEVGASCNLI